MKRIKKIETGTFKLKIPLLYLSIFLAIIFTSLGYAALNTDLSISGDAYVRVEDDIRVTSIKMISSENNAYETYNNKYTKDTTSTYVTMPNTNSKLTYEVEITNNSNSRYYLSNIEENIYSNKNIKYEIQDISVGDIIPSNTVKKIKMIFSTNTPNQNTDLVLKYVFKKVDKTEWVYAYTGGEQILTVPYNGRYKLETWGAQGGRGYYGSQSAAGGKGGYAVGTNYLYTGVKMYINSGGKGEDGVMPSESQRYQRTISAGGYNGGGKGYNYYPGNDFGCGGGGGATHIALVSGELKNLSSHATDGKILIVAGGGGGGSLSWYESGGYRSYAGGAAGGVSGESGAAWSTSYKVGTGGNQSTAGTGYSSGSFGLGGEGTTAGGAGGGAGYYGGGGSGIWASAGGGSSYIGNPLLTNKTMYCYNCQESSEESTKTISTTCTSEKPTSNCAKQGNGYAKITFID